MTMMKVSFGHSGKVELQKRRRQRGRHRHDALELGEAERQTDQRHQQDADQSGAADIAVVERHDHDEAEQAQDCRPLLEVAKRNQRRRIPDHDLRLFQRDDAEEEPDAGGNGKFEVLRNRVDDVFADPEDRDEKEDHAGAEHAGERLLPRVFVGQHNGEGEEGIQPHARRERDRVVGIERHDQRGHRGRNAGRDEYRALVHARAGEDLRVDEHDIDHGEEGRDAGDELGADIGAVLGQAEIAIEKWSFARGLRRVTHCVPPADRTRAVRASPRPRPSKDRAERH